MRRRRQYLFRLHPEVHAAFKLLCDRAGYKRLNEAIERIMLKCIEDGNLPIQPKGDRESELIRKVELYKKLLAIKRKLGWSTSA